MTYRKLPVLPLIAVAAVALLGPAQALPADKDEGWVNLFNGKDLKGWVQRGGKAKYKVDKLVVIDVTALGVRRPYSAYVPTGVPRVILEGKAYLVNLSNNQYELYRTVSLSRSAMRRASRHRRLRRSRRALVRPGGRSGSSRSPHVPARTSCGRLLTYRKHLFRRRRSRRRPLRHGPQVRVGGS